MAVREAGERIGQEARRVIVRRPQSYRTLDERGIEFGQRLVVRAQDAPGVTQHAQTIVGQGDPARVAINQVSAKRFFEALDLG